MNDLVKIAIWAVIVGGVFAYLWRKGYLMQISKYVLETREELKKCTWPSRDELAGSTLVVLISTMVLGGFIIASDYIILNFVRRILPKL